MAALEGRRGEERGGEGRRGEGKGGEEKNDKTELNGSR